MLLVNDNWDRTHVRNGQVELCAGYVRHVTHDEIADAIG